MRSTAFRSAIRKTIHQPLELTGDDILVLAKEDPVAAKCAFGHYRVALKKRAGDLRIREVDELFGRPSRRGRPIVRVISRPWR